MKNRTPQPIKTISLEPGEPMPVVVLPTSTADGNDRPRFLMPPLPFSTLNWLGAFGETVWHQHQRCCALTCPLKLGPIPDSVIWCLVPTERQVTG